MGPFSTPVRIVDWPYSHTPQFNPANLIFSFFSFHLPVPLPLPGSEQGPGHKKVGNMMPSPFALIIKYHDCIK